MSKTMKLSYTPIPVSAFRSGQINGMNRGSPDTLLHNYLHIKEQSMRTGRSPIKVQSCPVLETADDHGTYRLRDYS